MPVFDIEIVTSDRGRASGAPVQMLADLLGQALNATPGKVWVRLRYLDRDDYAARVVAALRGRSDGILQDPDTVKIIEDLKGRSSQFRELWASHDVRRAHSDVLEVEHPTGRLTLALVNLQGVGTPGTRLSAYVPANEESRRSLARLGTR